MKIEHLLYNIGENRLGNIFLSSTVLDTLKKYDKNLLIPSKIRQLISEKISHAEILRNKTMLNALIQSIQSDQDINSLAKKLDIKQNGNIRKKLLAMRIKQNSEKEKKLFEFFEVEYVPIQKIEITPEQSSIKPQRSLFAHQRIAVDEIQQYLNGSDHAALLHMPTGSGKTRTAMRVISNMFMTDKPTLVIWIALTEELCEQAAHEFQKTWEMVGDRPITIFRFFGKRNLDLLHEINNNCEGFIVASMSKLERVTDDQFMTRLADIVKLVVMDEAHHAIAPTYKRTIEILAKKHIEIKLLGLSATPGRTLDKNKEDIKLAEFFGTNKVMLKINNQNPVRFLIDNEYIADPDIKKISHGSTLTNADISLISKKLDIPESILEKIGKDVRRNIKIVSIVEELVNMGQKRLIVFTPSIQSSRDVAMTLSANGFKSYYIDSNLSPHRRREIIHDYRGDSDKEIILCNVNILTAGFDAPKTSAVVIARPTKSLVLYSQMIGRAIRGKKVNGNSKCFIRVIADDEITPFIDIASAFEHWESAWK